MGGEIKESHPSLHLLPAQTPPLRSPSPHMLREKEGVGVSTAMRKEAEERTLSEKWRMVVRREDIEIRVVMGAGLGHIKG